MEDTEVTRARADELLYFLPRFSTPLRRYATWSRAAEKVDDAIFLPYPVYDDDVNTFFRPAARPCRSDHDYDPSTAGIAVS